MSYPQVRLSLLQDVCSELNLPKVIVSQIARQLQEAKVTSDLPLLNVTQAAAVLGVSERRVRAICSEGRLGFRQGSRSFIIPRDDVIKFGSRQRRSGTAGQKDKASEMGKVS